MTELSTSVGTLTQLQTFFSQWTHRGLRVQCQAKMIQATGSWVWIPVPGTFFPSTPFKLPLLKWVSEKSSRRRDSNSWLSGLNYPIMKLCSEASINPVDYKILVSSFSFSVCLNCNWQIHGNFSSCCWVLNLWSLISEATALPISPLFFLFSGEIISSTKLNEKKICRQRRISDRTSLLRARICDAKWFLHESKLFCGFQCLAWKKFGASYLELFSFGCETRIEDVVDKMLHRSNEQSGIVGASIHSMTCFLKTVSHG